MVENAMILGMLVAAIGGAIGYIVKAKRRGKTCIGCPYRDECRKAGGCASQKTLDK